MPANIVEITDVRGKILTPEWLAKAESIHRQLRPHLPQDYFGKMSRVFSEGGRMSIATAKDSVVGVAVYRIYENTASGTHMYVDDLVTDEAQRSNGMGKALVDHLQIIALKQDCQALTLDSGTHRHQAHKFYFREGMTVFAFHFVKYLKERVNDRK